MSRINISPEADALWKGVGGHFDSFSEIIFEFVDNIISNYDKHQSMNRTAIISIDALDDYMMKVSIEDAGSGIKDVESALRLGDTSNGESPLNEHGFGFKHALASANPENNSWRIYTRTIDDLNAGQYRIIQAPYDFDINQETVSTTNHHWPGALNGAGTIFEFECSKELFETLIEDRRGNPGIVRCLEYLTWDLGYVYSNIITESRVSLTVQSSSTNFNQPVGAITPEWIGLYDPKDGEKPIALDGNKVQIEYRFGEVNPHPISNRHYQRSMATSGLEIRINGRLLENNLLTEVWGVEKHNKYNHFLGVVNILSDEPSHLPKTRTSKNGIRIGDKKLLDLFKWVKSAITEPPERLSKEFSERELIKKLKEFKEKHIRADDKRISNEFEVYRLRGTPVRADLYVFDGKEIVLYEAKKGIADMKSFYQLLMYWDGAVDDGLEPVEGILLAEEFSEGVKQLMVDFNLKKDFNGNPYNFICKTWDDEGIHLE